MPGSEDCSWLASACTALPKPVSALSGGSSSSRKRSGTLIASGSPMLPWRRTASWYRARNTARAGTPASMARCSSAWRWRRAASRPVAHRVRARHRWRHGLSTAGHPPAPEKSGRCRPRRCAAALLPARPGRHPSFRAGPARRSSPRRPPGARAGFPGRPAGGRGSGGRAPAKGGSGCSESGSGRRHAPGRRPRCSTPGTAGAPLRAPGARRRRSIRRSAWRDKSCARRCWPPGRRCASRPR